MADSGKQGFVTHPYLQAWVETNRPAWLNRLHEELKLGYQPKDCRPCLVPKAGAMIRPGAVLHPDDQIIYSFLVARLHDPIWNALKWSQGDPDVANQLHEPPKDLSAKDSVGWVKSGVPVWRQWREQSASHLTAQVSHVVLTDITGYYENIDIARLISDLKGLGIPDPEVTLLSTLLRRWSQPRGKGIPQGHTASDVLAKVYLNPIDLALVDDGFDHLRYVDDMRVFCQSRLQAKRALILLTVLMSQRGLNLQSAKTRIRTKTEAKPEIEGVGDKINDVTQKLLTELKACAPEGESVPGSVLFSLLAETKPEDSSREVLEETFKESFSANADQQFNKTLFHFLLARLRAVGSRVGIHYCLDILEDRPEETGDILRYLSGFQLSPEELDSLYTLAESPDCIYDYQLFQIVRWFFDLKIDSSRVSALCRVWANDYNRDPWLRAYAISYLGEYGNKSDLDKIEQRYSAVESEMEKAGYVAALKRLELSRRNAFYGKVKSDSDLVARAIKVVKATT